MDEKYQRIRVLGKGSFGKAYLVKNTEAGVLCVVKQMETSMMNDKERNEAVREAMLLKQMNHPNIVKFEEVFMTRKGRLCIVMDYADGGDVHMAIKSLEGKLIPEARILEWFAQICFALKHVHDRKVLHRDLKTQNVFLMETGQIKLGDFGIAKVLESTKDYAKTMVGTPYYLSPEIIEDRPYSFKSDIWSCGVVLYEMATLKHPFEADSLVILASKILRDQYPPLDSMYSQDLLLLIKSMLSKDARLRPSVNGILSYAFLQTPMHTSNSRYALDLDLSQFAKPREAAESPTMESAGPPGRRGLGSMPLSPVPEGSVDRDSGLQATAPPTPAQPARPEEEEGRREGDEEYDEEFEDYSGSEDEGKAPQSDLKKSVANLMLGGGAAAAQQQGLDPTEAGAGSVIGNKADSLRCYLKGQLTDAEFEKAYALVRSMKEDNTEEIQQRVSSVIGSEKAPELFTLFQLLCFLEDVSATTPHGAQPGKAIA